MVVVVPNIPVDQQTVVRGERDVADGDWYRFWKGEADAIRELQTAYPVTDGAAGVGWTTPAVPNLTFGGAAVGITYSARLGRYYKQGPLVHFFYNLLLTSKGVSVGNASLEGLPFANSTELAPVFPLRVSGMTAGVGDTMTMALLAAGASAMTPQKGNLAGGYATMTDADFGNFAVIRVNGTYYTTP